MDARFDMFGNEIATKLRDQKARNEDRIVLENQVNDLRLKYRTATAAVDAERGRKLEVERHVAAVTQQLQTERANTARFETSASSLTYGH